MMDVTALTRLFESVVVPLGLEVDAVQVQRAGNREQVRVFLDGEGPSGSGPDLDQIADATKAISRELDESQLVGSKPYVLEVSSRGVSRPLAEPKHYRRNRGRLVAVKLTDGGDLVGRIITADEQIVELDTDGSQRVLPYSDIAEAVVQVELNRGVASPATSVDEEADEE